MELRYELQDRAHIKDGSGEDADDLFIWAELYDVPLAFLKAVARTENGVKGYEMGQRSIHPVIRLVFRPDEVQSVQAARTLNRFAFAFLLEHPELGEHYLAHLGKRMPVCGDFVMMYHTRFVECLKLHWPDAKKDNVKDWAKNMDFFVRKWERTHR